MTFHVIETAAGSVTVRGGGGQFPTPTVAVGVSLRGHEPAGIIVTLEPWQAYQLARVLRVTAQKAWIRCDGD